MRSSSHLPTRATAEALGRRLAAPVLALALLLAVVPAASADAGAAPGGAETPAPREVAPASGVVEQSAPGELISTLRIEPSEVDAVAGPGKRRQVRIRVSNPSRRTSRRVQVCDALPRGVWFVRATPGFRIRAGQFCWTTSLRPGASTTFWIVGRVVTTTD